MIRGQRHYAVAVRHPDGSVVTRTEPLKGGIYSGSWLKTPLLRGPLILWDSLSLGMKALMFSADVAMSEDEEADKAVDKAGSDKSIWLTMAFSLVFSIVLFFVGPAWVTSACLDQFLSSSLASNVIEKLIRMGLLIGYIVLIGRMSEIQRVFSYHGAEHKAIYTYEAGLPLTVENARDYSPAHPRCGTNFLLVVMVISLFVFLLLGQPPIVERLVSRVLLIPVVAALAYEFIKYAGAREHNPLLRALMAPGLWLQQLTTREPEDGMIEVAIAAVEAAVAADGNPLPAADGVINTPVAGATSEAG